MNYNLDKKSQQTEKKLPFLASLKKLVAIISGERRNLIVAFGAISLNAALTLAGTYVIGYTIDNYVQNKDYHGVLLFAGILLLMYVVAFFVNYAQMIMMGGIGQRMLYSLRNSVFNKLQELPLDFFNQNKSGDLISRINNDTQKVNEFFSQSLMRFIGGIITMTGAGILLLTINLPLGLAALSPALVLLIFTRIISPWIRRKNEASLESLGKLSAEIQESLANFKVVVAFNRRDFFRQRFMKVNEENYKRSVYAGIANNVLNPVYTFAANVGQLIVLALGIWLIIQGNFSVGLLISFIAYVANFYNPLRQLAILWANFQQALAAWDRISYLLSLESNLKVKKEKEAQTCPSLVSFKDVSFSYPNGKEVLHKVNFKLERGKTYAFIGPTGGGKTTTASLIARLYDATKGTLLLDGHNIKSYEAHERAAKIGVILQEPILFSGDVRENILYGNETLQEMSNEELEKSLEEAGLGSLLQRFDRGLETPIQMTGDGISLGQKQLIAFMRAILRKPELLILDEATANIDTVTEKQLEAIISNLPASTTKVIIAHRLNTIESADEIFFVNSGEITAAGSFDEALNLLMQGTMES
ncbi:ABC transporter ATP-binding protein [Draconibacterium sp. IB214405]|uniref:ABC transporter ATP-binding protein n=1 Tax=Draconibacterium sp. IB214405 TaxID=3097352 RepID=UPI002A0E65AC|nr:ABC transporter ATP-binding protein [Draconibacterium sp. IB214405]MDX8339087.1 ABC transporter ATP-binding protein [Draconibacterium sp. IB214405]